jgi:hypothetical protein
VANLIFTHDPLRARRYGKLWRLRARRAHARLTPDRGSSLSGFRRRAEVCVRRTPADVGFDWLDHARAVCGGSPKSPRAGPRCSCAAFASCATDLSTRGAQAFGLPSSPEARHVPVPVVSRIVNAQSSALAQRPPARRAGRLGLLQQSLVARARVGQQSRRSDERSSDIPASIPSGIRAGRTGIVDEARREAQERVVELHLEEGTVILEEAQNSPHPDDHD